MPDPIYAQNCCCKNCEECPADCAECPTDYLLTHTGSPTGGPYGAGFDVAAEAHALEFPPACGLAASFKWTFLTCMPGGSLISVSSAPNQILLPFDAWMIHSASDLLIYYKPVRFNQKCCWFEGAYDIFWKDPNYTVANNPALSLVRA